MEEEIIFINKHTGEELYRAIEKQGRQAIIFSMIVTPIVVIGLGLLAIKLGIPEILKIGFERIKLIFSYIF